VVTHLSFDELSKENTMEAMSESGSSLLAQPVAATRVAEAVRSGCLARHFGMDHLTVEAWVYHMMARLCAEYDGGYWHYYELSNGGFYMACNAADYFDLAVQGNGFMGRVTADAAGVITCAMVYSHLSFMLRDGAMGRAFLLLREYVDAHAEAGRILAALD